MLNTLWSADEISVKEELKEDVLSGPDSPFHSSPVEGPPSSPLYRAGPGLPDYHKLSPAPAPDSTQPHRHTCSMVLSGHTWLLLCNCRRCLP